MQTMFYGIQPCAETFVPVVNPAPNCFSTEQIDFYNTHGYVTDVPLITGERLRALRRFLRDAKERVRLPVGFRSFHHDVPELFDLVTDDHIVAHVQDLLGPNVGCHVSAYVNRLPRQAGFTWHQDATYNPTDAGAVLVWLALEDADVDNGCMWFLPGTHQGGIYDWDYESRYVRAHKINDISELGTAIPIELKAGHAVFFSDLLPHCSRANTSERERPAYTMTYMNSTLPVCAGKNEWTVVCSGIEAHETWLHWERPVSHGAAHG